MRFSKVAAVAALSSVTEAQRPTNTSICDYYTTALLKNNTAENQLTVLTLVVNTVVIGNYTKPNIEGVTWPDVKVPGILANGTVNGTEVNLLPYFNGGLASTNRGGESGVAVNFLDGGGAAPLMMNLPADKNASSSNQYFLLTHLYQFFGTALGCSKQGMGAYPSYQGTASQYQVHKFMALNYAQTSYFIQQVGLSAKSFGVADSDVTAVGTLLDNTFNRRCSANATVIPSAGPVQQAICIDQSCPTATNATCSAYAAVVEPGVANSTNAMGLGNSSSTATASAANGGMPTASSSGGSGSASPTTGAGVKNAAGAVAAGALGVAAFFL